VKDKLTKRSVEGVKPAERDVLVWDTELPGFGVKVTPKGSRVYVLQYRHRGRAKRYTIGRHGIDVTAEEARREATRLRGLVADGQNPVADRARDRSSPTIKEFAERYMIEHATLHKKPTSASTDRRNLDNHVIPLLGNLIVADVQPADIARAVRGVAAGKTAKDEKTDNKRGRRIVQGGQGIANRVLALLSKMLTLAEVWGLRPLGSNPCRHAAKFAERKVERFLSTEELARLGAALALAERRPRTARIRTKLARKPAFKSPDSKSENSVSGPESSSAVAAIRMLLLTGCRFGEMLSLQWSHVDMERRLLRLPDSKTGAKAVYLSEAAMRVLKAIPHAENNAYVFPASKPGKPLLSLRKPWGRICKLAKLEGVRLHDLRHSFASIGAAGGFSLPVIGALLGHSQPATTARYAHLAASPLHEAVDAIGQRIVVAMDADRVSGS